MTALTERNIVLGAGVVMLLVAAVMVAVEPLAVISVLALPAVLGAVVLTLGILHGNRFATLALLFATIFLMHAVFRIREYSDKDVDFQVIIKMGVWLSVAAISVIHARRWLHLLLRPTNLPWVLFLVWLFATALVSPKPHYTLVSAFTVFASVIFSAYIFCKHEPVEIFATIVAAIAVFSAVSIVVYFVLPEFGHYVYWYNEERFVSTRLAGIAGSANNMALVAAFGLVVIGLYAAEFHRINRFFAPVSAVICGVALLMTQSRTPLAMAIVILFMTYLLNWRRLYAALFIASAGMVLLAALIPLGQETLLKAVSRSGEISEVTSFTGRTEIWYAVLKLAEMRPWTGYGYASSVFVLPEHMSDVGFLTSHAHNVVLQLLLTTGWVGVILFVLSIAGMALRAIVYRDKVTFAMMAFVLLNGITESSGFTTLANICTFAFGIAAVYPSEWKTYEDDFAYQRRFS
jgi:O-antigen ligase